MRPPGITLRHATPRDLDLLLYWGRQPHVLAATSFCDWNRETGLPRRPDWREQLIAELTENGITRPVGFIRVIDPEREETRYWGDIEPGLRAIDIWIGEVRDLGRGIDTRMMQLALERCFAGGDVSAVLVDPLAANERARRFYERFGFNLVKYRDFGDDHCAVYSLTYGAWKNGDTD